MKVAVIYFTHFDCEAGRSFVLSQEDIHWIENIQTLFNIVICSYSMPANYVL